MATAIDPQPLIAQATCTWCVIPAGLINYAILAALIDVANGVPVSSDPQVIIDQARCLECVIPQGFVGYAILAAVSNITGGGGGLAGAGSPEDVTTASPGTTYLDTSTNSFWVKSSGVGNTGWVQLIA